MSTAVTRRLALAALWPGVVQAAPEPARGRLSLYTTSLAPMNYLVGGQLQGWNVDVVRDVFERAGLEPDFQVQPMARALLTAKQQADCGCFPVVRSVEREDWFHWVGVISSQVGGFLALRDNPLQAQSLDDLRGRRIGVLNHDIRMEWLLRERFRMGAELELAPSQEANLRKLLVGRIDVWPIGLATARYLAEREGPDVLSRLRMVWRIPKGAIGGSAFTGNWLVLNPGVPEDIRRRIDAGYAAAVKAGSVVKAASRWQGEWAQL